jgi:hypothetical protein
MFMSHYQKQDRIISGLNKRILSKVRKIKYLGSIMIDMYCAHDK